MGYASGSPPRQESPPSRLAHPFDVDLHFVFVFVHILSLAFPVQADFVVSLQYHGFASSTTSSTGLLEGILRRVVYQDKVFFSYWFSVVKEWESGRLNGDFAHPVFFFSGVF